MMKTKFFTGALIALIAVACSQKEELQPVASSAEGLKVTASVEQPGTRTSLDGLDVKWTVGDRIYLTDGTNSAIYEATESSTTTSFAYVEGSISMEGDVYAYYPAENVQSFDPSSHTFTTTIPAVQPYVAGGFADGINPMTAKATVYDDALVLQFRNVMSFIGLQFDDIESDKLLYGLSIESPSAALSGTASVAVDEDGVAAVSVTGSNKVDLDQVSIYISTNPSPAYIAVPAGNVGKLTITALTEELGGSFSQEKVALNSLDAERSVINRYSVMSISSFNKKTLSPSAPANCYMVNATIQDSIIIPLSQALAGWDAIKTLEPADDFDVSKITSGERAIDVRWFDDAEGTINKENIDDKALKLSFSNCTNGTNAVVDLKNGDEVVWSWHLWFTDYRPAEDQLHTVKGNVYSFSGDAFKEGGLYNGKVVMDRNLGAVITGFNEPLTSAPSKTEEDKYYGVFYQFGRKDPFARTPNMCPYYKGGNLVTYAFAAKHPDLFVPRAESKLAWSSTDAGKDDEHMTDPWNSNGSKSMFDPCPAGWRIPNNGKIGSKNIFTGITTKTWQNATDELAAGQLWEGTWIPCAGKRLAGNGARGGTKSESYLWSSTPHLAGTAMSSYFLPTIARSVYDNNVDRAMACPVRCVKE